MEKSAFGVDHGGFSKGVNPNKVASMLRLKGPSGGMVRSSGAKPGQMSGTGKRILKLTGQKR